MKTNILSTLSHLSDGDIVAGVKRLTSREREVTAHLVAHLAEFDSRRLYLAEGFSSLFKWCTDHLHLSEHEAYGRIEAARAARKFPIVLEMLQDGSINITAVGLVAPASHSRQL